MKVILITGGSGFIGTNFIDLLETKGNYDIINYDKNPPVNKDQQKYWVVGNIMDNKRLTEVFDKHKPDTLVHLAARTDTLSDILEDYKENHDGTSILLSAIKEYGGIEKLIVTSTQYVYKNNENYKPKSETDFQPYTIYGQSKVLTEEYTHNANLKCNWTIIRPTNIWGPWHMRYPTELWKIIDQGLYYHPTSQPVIRTYGYVKNIAFQIYNILIAEKEIVNHKTFYVGDPSIDSYEWLNSISLQLNNKPIKRLPSSFFITIAKFGDILRKVKIPFPLYTRRYRNMVEDYPAPTESTVELFGQYESSMVKNVEETMNWLSNEGKLHFEYWKNKN